MKRRVTRKLRCDECGMVDPKHPESNKRGGCTVHWLAKRRRYVCLVCLDIRRERDMDRQEAKAQGDGQLTLGAYQ